MKTLTVTLELTDETLRFLKFQARGGNLAEHIAAVLYDVVHAELCPHRNAVRIGDPPDIEIPF